MNNFILSVAVCVAVAHGVLSQGTNGPVSNVPTQPQHGTVSTHANIPVAQSQQNNVFPMAQGQQNSVYPMTQGQQTMYQMGQNNMYSMGQVQQNVYPHSMGYPQQATHHYPSGYSNPMYNTLANQQYTNANTQANTESSDSFMNYLPFMLGGERGRQLATYSMMMNSNGNNMMLPLLMNGEHRSLLPMMALMNRGGSQRMNPVLMSMMMGQELI